MGPDLDAVAGFHQPPTCLPHTPPQGRVLRQPADGVGPLRRRLGQETRLAVAHQFALDADGVGHHGQTGGHVLEHLEAALAQAPQVVGHPADADVSGRHGRRLPLLAPGTGQHRQVPPLKKSVADQFQLEAGYPLPQFFQQGRTRLQAAQRARRADPDQLRLPAARVPGDRVTPEVHAGGDDADGPGPAGRLGGQESVARGDAVAGPDRGREPAQAVGGVQAAGGIRIAQEDGVVHVEDQAPGGAAQDGELPAGQQAALQDDVGPAQLAEQPQARPGAFRQRPHLQAVAGLPEIGRQCRQAVAAADVIGAFDDADPVHGDSFPCKIRMPRPRAGVFTLAKRRGKRTSFSRFSRSGERNDPPGKPAAFPVSAADPSWPGESRAGRRPSSAPAACRGAACRGRRPIRPWPGRS